MSKELFLQNFLIDDTLIQYHKVDKDSINDISIDLDIQK
jgi:hypothetical protein